MRWLIQTQRVADYFHSRELNYVTAWFLVAAGVHEVSGAQPEHSAVSEHLVKVGVRVAAGLLRILLGIDHCGR